ncbi:MAG: protein kinase [Pseudomonadota bacterium]
MPGTIVGHNRIEREIGQGGFGIVYLATDLEQKKPVALKFLNRETVFASFKIKHANEKLTSEHLEEKFSKHYQNVIERFKEEYQHQLLGINHPNIASVYEFGLFEDFLYFTSEYIEGYDIFVYTRKISEDSMPPFFIQLFEGLQFIHDSGLLHGDIKPENVLIKEIDGKPVVKIIDFGIATAITANKRHMLGTPMYIAPEVILSWENQIGASTDLFSAAALMYYCLAHTYPFKKRYGWQKDPKKLAQIVESELSPKSLKTRSPDIPEYLDTIVMRLLQRNPSDRFYGTARAVINALKTRLPDSFMESQEIKSCYLIPDKFVGCESEIGEISDSISSIAKGVQPSPFSVYCISGEKGLGKSCFLQEIRNFAEKKMGQMLLHQIRFPIDEEWALTWTLQLARLLDENRYPLLILIDDLHLFGSNGKTSSGFEQIRKSLIGLAHGLAQRKSQPQLYEHLKPVMFCFSSDPCQIRSSKNVVGTITKMNDLPLKMIDLKPFGEDGISNYLKSTLALKKQDISLKWIRTLLRQTGGIPSEISEQLIQLDSEGLLFDLDGNVHLFKAHAPEISKSRKKAPKTTENRIMRQYDALNTSEKRIIDLLSVWHLKWVSPPVSVIDLRHFFPGLSISQHLTSLCRKQILKHHAFDDNSSDDTNESEITLYPIDNSEQVLEDKTYTFYNPYFSDVIYDHLNDELKTMHHLAIAGFLKLKRVSSLPYRDALYLHTGFGNHDIKGLACLIKLARSLLSTKGEILLSQQLLIKALSYLPSKMMRLSIYVRSLLLHVYYCSGEYRKAFELYDESEVMTHGLNEVETNICKLRLFTSILPSFVESGQFDEAKEIISQARKISGNERFASHNIYFLNWEGRINFKLRNKDRKYLLDAERIYNRSRDLEKKIHHPNMALVTDNELGQILLALGKTSEAIEAMEWELDKCKKSNNILKIMLACLSLAEGLRKVTKYSEAVKYAQEAYHLAKQISHGRWLVIVHSVLSACYFDSKKFDRSIAENQHCLSASTCLDSFEEHERVTKFVWVNTGNCYNEKGEFNESPKYFEAAMSLGNSDYLQVRAELGLAEAYIHTKKFDEAYGLIDQADSAMAKLPDASHALKFVSGYWKFNALKMQNRDSEARSLLPFLKKLAGNNPVLLDKFKEISNSKIK